MRIEVAYSYRGEVHGVAGVGYGWIRMKVPGAKYSADGMPTRRLAQIFIHEIQHTLGFRHKDMPDWWMLEPKWHRGIKIPWKPAKPRKVAASDRIATRAAHAEKMLKKAETRLKRAKTIRDKWARKAKYYRERDLG